MAARPHRITVRLTDEEQHRLSRFALEAGLTGVEAIRFGFLSFLDKSAGEPVSTRRAVGAIQSQLQKMGEYLDDLHTHAVLAATLDGTSIDAVGRLAKAIKLVHQEQLALIAMMSARQGSVSAESAP